MKTLNRISTFVGIFLCGMALHSAVGSTDARAQESGDRLIATDSFEQLVSDTEEITLAEDNASIGSSDESSVADEWDHRCHRRCEIRFRDCASRCGYHYYGCRRSCRIHFDRCLQHCGHH